MTRLAGLRMVRDAAIPKEHHHHINRYLNRGDFDIATNIAKSWIITARDEGILLKGEDAKLYAVLRLSPESVS